MRSPFHKGDLVKVVSKRWAGEVEEIWGLRECTAEEMEKQHKSIAISPLDSAGEPRLASSFTSEKIPLGTVLIVERARAAFPGQFYKTSNRAKVLDPATGKSYWLFRNNLEKL